jgi:hypothetical protein
MDLLPLLITASLAGLTALLGVLSVRGLYRFLQSRSRPQLMWGSGLALAALAVAIEAIVYLGVVDSPLLQAYLFCSAAIVGVLSLGATRILRRPLLERAYTAYTLAACAVVGVASAMTFVPLSMVQNGVISGNPPPTLLVLSSFVTFPATVVLLSATAMSLRRDWRWQTLLIAAGALILGAGGTLYIASFPIALYYSEFLGIIVLFIGLVSLPTPAAAPAPTRQPSAAP